MVVSSGTFGVNPSLFPDLPYKPLLSKTAQRQAKTGCSKWSTRVSRPASATSRN